MLRGISSIIDDSLTNQRFLCLQPSHHCEPLQASIQLLKDIPSKPAENVLIFNGCFDKNNPLLSNNHRKRTASVTFENRILIPLQLHSQLSRFLSFPTIKSRLRPLKILLEMNYISNHPHQLLKMIYYIPTN